MFKNILEGTQGVDGYGIFSLAIFFIFFCVMVVWIMKVKKSYLSKMQMLPLDDSENIKNQIEPN